MASVMKCGKVRTWLEAGWGFITLGLALTIVAFLLGVVYFSIRAITTSLEHIDIVPTYATALLVCCVGILTMFLYKRRDTMITVPTLVLSIVSILLTLASFLLLITKVIQTMMSFQYCQYDVTQQKCFCQTMDAVRLVYSDATSCHVIESNLLHLAYTQCFLFMMAFLLTTIATSLIAHTIHQDRKSAYLLEEEEIFQEPELEVVRVDSQRNPLIGRYRQLLSRPIVLPSCHYDVNGDMSQNIQQTSSSVAIHRDEGQDNDTNDDILADGLLDVSDAIQSHQISDQLSTGTHGGHHQVGYQFARGNILNGVPSNGVRADALPTTGLPSTEPPARNLLWDGYCRRTEADVAILNRRLNERATSAGCHNNPWSLQPILFPPDLSRGNSGRSRRRPRQRHRMRYQHSHSQPYVAFVPVPYSMYRPNALLGMGVSPFPMEPPPPYLAASQPPPYSQIPAAPAYTSRGTSPIADGHSNHESSLYESIDI